MRAIVYHSGYPCDEEIAEDLSPALSSRSYCDDGDGVPSSLRSERSCPRFTGALVVISTISIVLISLSLVHSGSRKSWLLSSGEDLGATLRAEAVGIAPWPNAEESQTLPEDSVHTARTGSLDGDIGVAPLRGLLPAYEAPVQNYAGVAPLRGLLSTQTGTLYCYTLVRPDSYEVGLMVMQKSRSVGIFDCDGNHILSNKALGQGFNVALVNSDLNCPMGGEFMTALNTDIFMAVWTTVINLGEYEKYDWTVKVDPDCVFFPSRLRQAVTKHALPVQGAYLINCKFGLHGPLEVFSKLAVNSFAVGSALCVSHLEKLCQGPCPWGEDMFIDQCMSRVLRVPRLNDGTLLAEDHCDSPGWQECKSGMAAFHPFKTTAAFEECLDNAAKAGQVDPWK